MTARSFRNVLGALVLLTLAAPVVQAAVLSPTAPITVLGTDVFTGPTLTAGQAYLATDQIAIEASGTVDLASGTFTANAAGIIVAPSTTNTGAHPGDTSPSIGNGLPYAALMIGSTSAGLPFVPLFPATAAYGLGDPSPPTTIAISRSFADLWGGGLANGTVLEFRVNDINDFDNSGAFRLSARPAAVPVPGPVALFGVGLIALAVARRRRI